jgi:hypothetical protein
VVGDKWGAKARVVRTGEGIRDNDRRGRLAAPPSSTARCGGVAGGVPADSTAASEAA